MTHPLTPREKVAQLIDEAPDHQTADELADAILTALASGSGDHAELARLAETNKAYGFLVSVQPEIVLSLLADIAALRAEHVHLVEQKEGAEDALFNALSRATEAERKLAEAVGYISWMRVFVPTVWDVTNEHLNEIDAFLSKEAERG